MKPFLTNVRHILKAGVSPPAWQPDPPDVLHFAAWSLVLMYLFYPPAGVQDHSESSWQLQLVKVLKCRLVERQVGVGWVGGGSNCTGGQTNRTPTTENRDAPRSRRRPVWGQMHNRTSGASVICCAKIFCQIFLVYLSSKQFAIVEYILQILFPVNFLFGGMRSLRRKKWCGEEGPTWAAPWFPLSGGREGAVLGGTISLS